MPIRDSEFAEIMAGLGQLFYDELTSQQIKHATEKSVPVIASTKQEACNV